jgi:hypothetical protein
MRTTLALPLLALAVSTAPVFGQAKKVTFDEHVLPVLRDKCTACHDQDKKRAGLRLDNYVNLLEGGSSGPVVKPGDPEGSSLYLVTAHKREPFMPPKSPPIATEQVALLRAWIEGGCLENSGSKPITGTKPKTDIGLTSVVKGKPEGPPPMPTKPLPLDVVVRTARPAAVTALASSPWSPLVAVGGQKQVLLYHADTLDLLGVLPFPEGVPHVLKFSRNGSLLLAGGGRGGKSGRVVVWSVLTGERVLEVGQESDCVLAADLSPDQTQIALGGPSKVLRLYSTKDGKLLHEIRKHTDWIYTLEYSPDGVLLASGDRNGGLFVWEAFTAREFFGLRGHTAAVTEVSWRADSNVLASTSEDGTVRLWEMENGNPVRSWPAHGGGSQSVRFGRDGRLVSAGRDRLVKVWDGNGAQQRAFEAFPDVALRTVFSHDGSRVVAGDLGGVVRVCLAADGKLAGVLAPNPPSPAEQLEAATKELIAAVAARDRLVVAAKQSQEAAQKAAAELAAAQKAVTDTAAAVKTAMENAAKAKLAADAAAAAMQAGQADVNAKDVLAKALAEAAAKVTDASALAPVDKALAAAAAKAKEIAAAAANDLGAAQKNLPLLTQAAKIAADQSTAAAQAVTTATAAMNAAPQQVPPKAAAAKAAADRAAADKLAADRAVQAVTDAAAKLDRWKAALLGQPAKP